MSSDASPVTHDLTDERKNELETLGLKYYENQWCLSSTPSWLVDAVKDFQFRADDVIVAGYPKTGVFWLPELVWLIMNDVDFKAASESALGLRVPFLEHRNQGLLNPLSLLNDMDSPRLMKTHWTTDKLSESYTSSSPKTIVVLRNPKDSLVALYLWYTNNNYFKYEGSWDDFYTLYQENNLVEGNYLDFTLNWWDKRSESNVLIVLYSDYVHKPKSVVEKVAEFCGKSLNGTQIEELCHWIGIQIAKEEGRKPDIYKQHFTPDQMGDLQVSTYCTLAYKGLLFK